MYKKDLRKKILKWLFRLVKYKNSMWDYHNIADDNLELFEDYLDIKAASSASSKMFQHNATKFFESKNISISDLNITNENINEFLKQLMIQAKKPLNLSDSTLDDASNKHDIDICDNYCNSFIRDMLLGYKSFHGYISLMVCIFGTIANILNIIVLTRKDMSKTPINTILKWLAVADMFVMIEYILFTSHMYLDPARKKTFPWAIYLLFHMHFTQILHTISISLTVTLAVWRYVAIKHPHGKFATYLLSHCSEAILLSFIISPILCLPTYFVFTINEKRYSDGIDYILETDESSPLYRFNFWVHSVIIKLIPCLVLTIISFILIRVLCQAAKRKVKLKGYSQPCANVLITTGHRPSRCERRTDRTTMLLVAVLLLFLITEFPQGILGLLSGILQKCFFTRCYSLFGEMMDLLALINAAVGFVLYGLMSKQFRTSFKSVFFKTRLSRLEMTRITGLNTTCV